LKMDGLKAKPTKHFSHPVSYRSVLHAIATM